MSIRKNAIPDGAFITQLSAVFLLSIIPLISLTSPVIISPASPSRKISVS